MKTIHYGFLMMILWVMAACNQNKVSGPGGANVQGQTVAELEAELLGAACNEDMKKDFQSKIQHQRNVLKLSDAKLKNSIRNMKARIKCV